jgi:CubicO group peptidase (beta-lactamase class C family)
MKRIFSSLLLLLFIVSHTAFAQVSSKQVDELVKQAMDKFNVAGVAVGIVQNGKVIHCKGYGVQSVDTKKPVTEHTNFAIASNSKAFTATAMALLVEESLVSWDDPVRKYIPEFKMYNSYVTENFTIADLLSHRSGMGLGEGDLMWFPDGSDFTIDDMITAFEKVQPESGFRTKMEYNNILFFIAGEVIKRVSGKSWEDFVKERIFTPLNMDKSVTSISQISDRKNLASPHANKNGKLLVLPDYAPQVNGAAAGIYANVDDLCNWMNMQLSGGKYGTDKQLFSTDAQREMWKIHTVLDASRNPRYNSHFSGYGLGWFLTDVQGKLQVSHSGGMPGMLSKTTLLPDLGVGIVILTNTSDDGAVLFSALTNTLVDSYLGLDDNKWIDKYHSYFVNNQAEADSILNAEWKIAQNASKPCFDEANIMGVYEDHWFGEIRIERNKDDLMLKSTRSTKMSGPLYYYGGNTYLVKWLYQDMNADAYVTFTFDEKGKSTGFSLKGISPNVDFSFDFEDLHIKRK